MKNGQSLRQKMLGKLDIYIPKNEANIVYKNYLKSKTKWTKEDNFFLISSVWEIVRKLRLLLLFLSHSVVSDSATPWTAAHQASLSSVSWSLLKLIHWVSDAIQPSHPLSSPSPSALNLSQHQVFSNESALHIRWPKYWSFSISPSNESGLISFRINWFDLLAVQGTLKSVLQHHSLKASIHLPSVFFPLVE